MSTASEKLMSKFMRCFPGDNDMVVCQHWNGSYIVFPGTRTGKAKTAPVKTKAVLETKE